MAALGWWPAASRALTALSHLDALALPCPRSPRPRDIFPVRAQLHARPRPAGWGPRPQEQSRAVVTVVHAGHAQYLEPSVLSGVCAKCWFWPQGCGHGDR